jgi:cytochrome c oxidase cbb3-type subunit 3
MAKERDELLDHNYDGIQEFDNPLPGWWLGLFYATILFAVIFIPYYYLGFGPTSAEEYEQEMAEARAMYPGAAAVTPPGAGAPQPGGQAPQGAAAPPVALPSLRGDAAAIEAGKAIFTANCLPCHGAQGEGGIGPNLTDRYWLHGNTYDDMVNTITNGVPDKGMIAWKAMLNPEKIRQAAAFVYSLKGTNPPNPKAAQGQEYPE